MVSTSSATVNIRVVSGPKFHGEAYVSPPSRESAEPSARYPDNGSRTCCHGRIALGDRKISAFFDCNARTASGTMRLAPQSPPPITLPARAEANRTCPLFEFAEEKKDSRNDSKAISMAALLAL